MSRPWTRILGAALFLLLAVGGGYLAGHGGAKGDKAAAAPQPPAPPPGPPTVTLDPQQLQYAQLQTGTARVTTLATRLSALGTVAPNLNGIAQVSSRLAGKVVRIPVNVGQSVEAGQPLLVVASIELDQAQALYHDSLLRRVSAASTLSRTLRLGSLGVYGRPALVTARTNFQQSQGEIQADKDAVNVQQAQVASAEAQGNLTQKQYARAQLLYQSQLVSRQDLEQSEANAHQAQAALAQFQTSLRAAVDRQLNAQKRGQTAGRELSRQAAVYNGGLLTAEQVTPARQAYQLAAHEVEAAAKQVELLGGSPIDEASPQGGLLTITSPISGRVSARMVSLGETVTPDKPLLTILNARTVVVQLNVYQEDVSHLRVGLPVLIVSNTAPGHNYRGVVSTVGAALDTSTRTVPVYCLIQNPDGALRPGAYIGGTIYGAARANVVAVPQEAVQALDAGPAVFMPGEKPGVYVVQPVKTGETVDGMTQITSGLRDGQAVVTRNALLLKSELGKTSSGG